jgi:hypothetical protein
MARGLPVFATLTYLWFSSKSIEAGGRILVGILAMSGALALSLLCQQVLAVHLRPIFDKSIDVASILQWDMGRFEKRHYSFASGTNVLYFGLAA